MAKRTGTYPMPKPAESRWARWLAPSGREPMTAAELAAWLAHVEADPGKYRSEPNGPLEVQCPCCAQPFAIGALRGHVEHPPESCDRARWGAIVGTGDATPGDAADCGFLELRPFAETADRRVWELELVVTDLRDAVASLSERVNGTRWTADVILPPLDTVPPRPSEPETCAACAAAYPSVSRDHHDWLLSFESRGVAGCVEMLALFDQQASNGGGGDGEVAWVDFRDWAGRHQWTDPAAVADFADQVESLCRLRETATQAAMAGTGRS